MSTAAERIARGSRRFVAVGAGWFVVWQLAAFAGAGRGTVVALGLYGFVLHTVFGKAYSLLPTYFDRALAVPRAPTVHLPLASSATAAMAAAAAGIAPAWVQVVGRCFWAAGVLLFVGVLVSSVRDNLTGAETATSEGEAHRRHVDRIANAFVPVALSYLVAGAALPVLAVAGLPTGPMPAAGPAVTHLPAAGTAALLLFALGFRLLPRFLVVAPRPALVGVVLPAGAIAPALLATQFGNGTWFRVGAALQAAALVGFAAAYVDMFVRSDRRRVGLCGLLVPAAAAVAVAGLGGYMASTGGEAAVGDAHARLALLGFLGTAIVAVSYQFYPPAAADSGWVDDRTAIMVLALLAGGLALEAGGLLAGVAPAVTGGRSAALAGAGLHAAIVASVFRARRYRG